MSKQIISIGSNCTIKLQYDRNYSKSETQIFDYLITGSYLGDGVLHNKINKLSILNIVNLLLRNKQFDKSEFSIISKNMLDIYAKETMFNPTHSILFHKDFISIHDLNLNHNNFDECIDKFNRRYQRLKDLIHSNKRIEFVRIEYTNYNIEDYIIFINTIKKLNKNCDFIIKLVVSKKLHFIHIPEIKLYEMNSYKLNQAEDMFFSHLDWKRIFND